VIEHAMRIAHSTRFPSGTIIAVMALIWPAEAGTFEGRINATLTRGGETQTLLYTIGTNQVRIERAETNWPHAKNIVNLDTGATTLLFPHNGTFVRLRQGSATVPVAPVGVPPTGPVKPGADPGTFFNPGPEVFGQRPKTAGETPALPVPPTGLPPGIGPRTGPPGRPDGAPGASPSPVVPPGAPVIPNLPQLPAGLPPGIGPQTASAGVVPGMPAMPMPMMPVPGGKLELQATTNGMTILGLPCTRYELKQRGETMEIWATDKLPPFQPYLQNQPHHFGPRMIEEQWGGLLKARGLFPLLAILKFENGPERLRFEVKSVRTQKLDDKEGKLFQPPAGYHELQPLPF
jgi:hypothetical protein